MLNLLFMTVFADPEYKYVRPDEKEGTTLWTQTDPTCITAVAATKNNQHGLLQGRKAISYFNALQEAKKLDALEKTVDSGAFTISSFKTNAGMALVKFWKNITGSAKTVLSCVIDLGKNENNVKEAQNIQASWLDYFWNLWSKKDTILTGEARTYTPFEKSKYEIPSDNATSEQIADLNKLGKSYGEYKGHLAEHSNNPELKGEKKENRANYMAKYVLPALQKIPAIATPDIVLTQYFAQVARSTYLRSNLTLDDDQGRHGARTNKWFGENPTQEMVAEHNDVATELKARVWENFMGLLTNLAKIDAAQGADDIKTAANAAWDTSKKALETLIDPQDLINFAGGDGTEKEPFPTTKVDILVD